ncbi:MAG: bifunctional UDP-N-acetylglucosamine diphosphorylase/glucosamine-1-phosphate N-acetyltransferase GlmU [Dinoroseobacter sp.]|nr:bifunctional UDP-N-acetylglucosamine diphosphorylase/glucosamine-1-phosphate N-acetyltransferase GlmU [Dinoroseobacter sp.]
MSVALVILAAGQGTRMNSELPKVLHRLAGAPLLAHAMRTGAALEPVRTVIVTGHGAAEVEATVAGLDAEATCVRQAEQLGTGHAVMQAQAVLAEFDGDVAVLYGDTPFVRTETLEAMAAARDTADLVVLGFEAADPSGYGRLVTEGDRLLKIVEHKDASSEERAITLCNSGLVLGDARTMMRLLDRVSNDNAAGEYYLTDLPEAYGAEGLVTRVVICDEAETLGINTRAELAAAEAAFQSRARAEALVTGVTLEDPSTTYFAYDTIIGRDAVIGPQVVFGAGVTVESGAEIRAFCHLEGAHVARGAIVGPYARLRPGAELSEDARVGNFVEIKNATLAEGAKVNHLSYIGDAAVGTASNIGAGTITCNYDGVFKHRTEIGDRVFIGSNTMLVAPVTVGDDAMTASGSVITENVPEAALAVARAQQTNKPGLAKRFMEKLRLLKAAKKGS